MENPHLTLKGAWGMDKDYFIQLNKDAKMLQVITQPVDLDQAKIMVEEIQKAASALFLLAWEKGWHTELAAYSMTLKGGIPDNDQSKTNSGTA